MKIAVAFDSFKGCVSGIEASEYVAAQLRQAGADAFPLPLADGGEGTARALASLSALSPQLSAIPPDAASLSALSPQLSAIPPDAASLSALSPQLSAIPTVDAYGSPVNARAYLLPGNVAAVDMASCIGLGAAEGTARARVMDASSYGLGLLLRRLADQYRPKSILLGAGGSASCDGAMGLLAALGAQLRFRSVTPPLPAGRHLAAVEALDISAVAPLPPVTLLCDVRAPLLGPDGAALRFAPQKGATPAQTLALDAGLKRWCRIVARTIGADPRSLAYQPGMGTAGGITLAARLLGWQAVDGAEYVVSLLADRLRGAELVITGEGRTDLSTLLGKAPYALMRRARSLGIPTALISGQITLTPRQTAAAGFASAQALSRPSTLNPQLSTRHSQLSTLSRLARFALDLLPKT